MKKTPEWENLKNLVKELSYEKREVTLVSGRKSNFYIDVKQTALNAEGAYLIGSLIFQIVKKEFKDAKAVGGITMGADPLSTSTSLISYQEDDMLHAFYIRKEAKSHGTGRFIEGIKNLKEGMKVVILEDVVTTGGSTIKACERAKEFGLDVLGIISIVDRQEGGRENIEEKGYKFISIIDRSDIEE